MNRRANGITQQRAIKVRIYPNKEQQILFAKTFGCCRYVWNQMLADEERFYAETDTHFITTPAKYKTQASFLREVDSLALCNEQLALTKAFKNFFEDPKKFGHPSFKSKKRARKSYTTNCHWYGTRSTIQLVHNGIKLPKAGIVKANIHRQPMPGWKLKAATISQSKSGKYFCSLLYEFKIQQPVEVLPIPENTIGLDYSSPLFYVDDQGHSPEKLCWFRESEKKLARLQRQLTRMNPGSKNYIEQQHKIKVLQEHIANQRKDFTHKESRRIANAYGAVCVEDLDLKAISRSLNLGKSTMDNGFGMFRTFLQYKLSEYGKHLIFVDKWYPSSKTCHHCGYINKGLALNDREWICPNCGTTVIRDLNAGQNIKDEGLRQFYGKLAVA